MNPGLAARFVENRTPVRLSIFHTNDMHGRLHAMGRLSSFSKRVRDDASAQGIQTFFWDAGDAFDHRDPLCRNTKGLALVPILNAMRYGLQTMGNDILLSYGPRAMSAVAGAADFPVLAANIRDKYGHLPGGLQEYVLIALPYGLTMAVIGLTDPEPERASYAEYGLDLPDYVGIARSLVSRLRQEAVALIVVLSHLGLEDDRRLAESVAGIDVIIGGHSHHVLPTGQMRDAVLIAQAGEYAEALGRVDLSLDPATGRLLARSACVLDVPKNQPSDPFVVAAIDAAKDWPSSFRQSFDQSPASERQSGPFRGTL